MTRDQDQPTFCEAVEIAKLHFVHVKPESKLRPKPSFLGGSTKSNTLQVLGIRRLSTDPEKLISDARRNPDAYDSLRFALGWYVALQQELPPSAAQWLSEFLLGRIESPMRPDGAPKSPDKKFAIHMAVDSLIAKGMPKHASSYGSKTSAFEAVAQALEELEMTPKSYDGVRKIYREVEASRQPNGSFRLPF